MKARNVSLEFRGRQNLPLCHKAQLRQYSLPNKQLYTPKGERLRHRTTQWREVTKNYDLSVTEEHYSSKHTEYMQICISNIGFDQQLPFDVKWKLWGWILVVYLHVCLLLLYVHEHSYVGVPAGLYKLQYIWWSCLWLIKQPWSGGCSNWVSYQL